MAKIQPSVLNIKFVVSEGQTKYIDISESASIVNRRFYRQGLNWVVAGFTVGTGPIASPPGQGDVTISKIPNTWVASNAWHKAYAHWKKQQDEAISDAGAQSAVAKYRDFKVHANVNHVTSTFASNLIPVDGAGVSYLEGEWQASQIVLPQSTADASGTIIDPTELYLHMVGDNQNATVSRGIIEGYADSRAYPQSPDPVSPDISSADNWLAQMFNVGSDDEEVLLRATHVNDDLPYNQVNYPGGENNAPHLEIIHEQTFVPSTSSTSRKLSGTNVPCGLLEVISTVAGPIDIFVHLVPGPSRGYLTQPMQDM
jgi:hypothetical protein